MEDVKQEISDFWYKRGRIHRLKGDTIPIPEEDFRHSYSIELAMVAYENYTKGYNGEEVPIYPRG